jgi:phage baseplate assembly protein W
MSKEAPETPQIALPFEILSDGTVREVEQDSVEEIAMSVEAILRYPLNYREELPDFGMPDLTFAETTEDLSSLIQAHVARWEDRVRVLVAEDPDRWTEMVREFTVRLEAGS